MVKKSRESDRKEIAEMIMTDFSLIQAEALCCIIDNDAEGTSKSFNEMSSYLENPILKDFSELHIDACRDVADMQMRIREDNFAGLDVSVVRRLTVNQRTSDKGLVL